MEQHYGQIVEKVIRRNGYSISELARLTNVNRRSVYNWFNQRRLKPELIYRIGSVLNYDFSTEFPSLYPTGEPQPPDPVNITSSQPVPSFQSTEQLYWKDKYIHLLERYNDLLVNYVKNTPQMDLQRNGV